MKKIEAKDVEKRVGTNYRRLTIRLARCENVNASAMSLALHNSV